MLPTAGFFSKADCPFFSRGLCKRPFCHYKHTTGELVYLSMSPGRKAAGDGENHVNHSQGNQGHACVLENGPRFLELERINKEIETVKCEVEKEQWKLSQCQTLQIPHVTTEKPANDCNGNSHAQAPSVARRPRNKYAVDSTRPKTDLEYDPLSNYSAALRPSVPQDSMTVEKKAVQKRTWEHVCEEEKEVKSDVFESDDEGVLVIDIPPAEKNKNNQRPSKLTKISSECNPCLPLVPDRSGSQDVQVERSTAFVSQTDSHLMDVNVHLLRASKSNVDNVFEDISKCLENLRSESEKIPALPQNDGHDRAQLCDVTEDSHTDSQQAFPQMVANHGKILVAGCEDSKVLQPIKPRSAQTASVVPLIETSAKELALQNASTMADSYLLPSANSGVLPIDQKCLSSGQEAFDQLHGSYAEVSCPETPNATPPLQQHMLQPSARCQHAPSATAPTPSDQPTVIHHVSDSEHYSDVELSDSDPMEECYRIFMESNQPEVPPACDSLETLQINKSEEKVPPMVTGPKKRVAHISKQEPVNSKQQVIVPLRSAVGSAVPIPSRLQQVQYKPTIITTAVRGRQTFITSTAGMRKLENPVTFSSTQNACMNFLPAGAALQWGNVHFLIPEGGISLPVSQVPIVSPSPIAPTHVPVLPQITHTHVKQVAQIPAQPVAPRRKSKSRTENSVKVPHDVRQRYVNLFVEEFLKTSATAHEAFNKALAEEKSIYDKSVNKLKYLSVVVNVLKRLKNQSTSSREDTQTNTPDNRGHVALKAVLLHTNESAALYSQLKEYVLSESMLKENNFPFAHPERPGLALQYVEGKKGSSDPLKRICCRCGATYSVSKAGTHVRKEECNYHCGRVVENKVPGGVETRYSCCEGAIGTAGCQVFKLHVHDAVSLEGFVSSVSRPAPGAGCHGVYALDCEMCYTTKGVELVRVTVVNPNLQVLYDTFVKPGSEVIDYNTRLSGISEEEVSGASSSLCDVQTVLLSFISAETILIGHSLQSDLCALKLIHASVVDTSVVFPHRLGLPNKRPLRTLVADYLRRIIQESVEGHDTREDATACMELMLWKVKEDSKVKRW